MKSTSGMCCGIHQSMPQMTEEELRRGYGMALTYGAMRLRPTGQTAQGRMPSDLVQDILLRIMENNSVMPWVSGQEMFLWMRPRIIREIWRDVRKTSRRAMMK